MAPPFTIECGQERFSTVSQRYPIVGALRIAKGLGVYEDCLSEAEGNKFRAEFLAKQRIYWGIHNGRYPFVRKWKGNYVMRLSEMDAWFKSLPLAGAEAGNSNADA